MGAISIGCFIYLPWDIIVSLFALWMVIKLACPYTHSHFHDALGLHLR
ncbi:hypothetical protein SLEP1_g49494 [Rubroshorea leprosula]|uniref:Uncharacterized protein n=1 Tax=Rubroshorea leprosula TaxID=152421 RepID=A0AAV5LX07_9ROSI|nr:hypothetical protein SLEP1_g49494 [Rubroshorea leprosula]